MCSAENKINQLQEDFTDKIHHKWRKAVKSNFVATKCVRLKVF